MFDIDFNGIFDEMLERMQTPKVKQATRKAVNVGLKKEKSAVELVGEIQAIVKKSDQRNLDND